VKYCVLFVQILTCLFLSGISGLSGNRFDIVLRNVCIGGDANIPQDERIARVTSVLKSAAKCMKDSGFINYFGMQRFGKFHDTHDVGIAVLKGDFEQACEIILRVKENENHRCIAPREKWAKRFDGINMEDDKAVQDAEMQCAKVVQRELGRFMNCETSIVSSLARNPRDYKKAFGSIAKHMRSMFLHAYQSYIWNKAASHRITDGGSNEIRVGDLVLVEDKGLADGGNGTSGLKGKAVKEVTQDDVETCKYSITDVVLPLAGSKIEYPTDSTGDVYDDLLAEAGLGKEDFDKIGDRELAVGGDYRKIICKPSDVNFEIKLYTDPVQPIVKTDLMDVHNASLECVDVTDEVKKDETTINTEEKMIIGMVVGFTLPPSAYATIALREMTRRPTSSQYQTELSLEGDCEANLGKAKTESSYYGAS
jgi:tRNA pseudouridine13 synthase